MTSPLAQSLAIAQIARAEREGRAVLVETKPAVWESRLSCDHCGEDQAELRIYPLQGWVPDQVVCQTCCTARDGEHDFKDFALAQGAAQ